MFLICLAKLPVVCEPADRCFWNHARLRRHRVMPSCSLCRSNHFSIQNFIYWYFQNCLSSSWYVKNLPLFVLLWNGLLSPSPFHEKDNFPQLGRGCQAWTELNFIHIKEVALSQLFFMGTGGSTSQMKSYHASCTFYFQISWAGSWQGNRLN